MSANPASSWSLYHGSHRISWDDVYLLEPIIDTTDAKSAGNGDKIYALTGPCGSLNNHGQMFSSQYSNATLLCDAPKSDMWTIQFDNSFNQTAVPSYTRINNHRVPVLIRNVPAKNTSFYNKCINPNTSTSIQVI